MTDHYVRHMLEVQGCGVSTEYECRAEVGSKCRLTCIACERECREGCTCDEPDLQDYGRCLIVEWLTEDAPDEQFNGERQPIRGPDWQLIVPEWNGDNWEWDYKEDDQ